MSTPAASGGTAAFGTMSGRSSNSFGEILVERGILSAEALEQAVRLKERMGGSLAVNLVLSGAVDDQTLASFYQERFAIDRASDEDLELVPLEVFNLIPMELIYDAGLFPLRRTADRLEVAIIDPSEPDVLEEAAFFAALELVPQLMTIGQMARHYPRVTGKRWKIDWETVLARRRIHQARTAANAEGVMAQSFAEDEKVPLTEEMKSLFRQTQELDVKLDELFDADAEPGAQKAVIKLVSVGDGEAPAEDVIEVHHERRPEGVAAERKKRAKIVVKARGENRWYLDPVEGGEVRVQKRQTGPTPPVVEGLPSIVLDVDVFGDSHDSIDVDVDVDVGDGDEDDEVDEDFILLTPRNIKPDEGPSVTHLVPAPDPSGGLEPLPSIDLPFDDEETITLGPENVREVDVDLHGLSGERDAEPVHIEIALDEHGQDVDEEAETSRWTVEHLRRGVEAEKVAPAQTASPTPAPAPQVAQTAPPRASVTTPKPAPGPAPAPIQAPVPTPVARIALTSAPAARPASAASGGGSTSGSLPALRPTPMPAPTRTTRPSGPAQPVRPQRTMDEPEPAPEAERRQTDQLPALAQPGAARRTVVEPKAPVAYQRAPSASSPTSSGSMPVFLGENRQSLPTDDLKTIPPDSGLHVSRIFGRTQEAAPADEPEAIEDGWLDASLRDIFDGIGGRDTEEFSLDAVAEHVRGAADVLEDLESLDEPMEPVGTVADTQDEAPTVRGMHSLDLLLADRARAAQAAQLAASLGESEPVVHQPQPRPEVVAQSLRSSEVIRPVAPRATVNAEAAVDSALLRAVAQTFADGSAAAGARTAAQSAEAPTLEHLPGGPAADDLESAAAERLERRRRQRVVRPDPRSGAADDAAATVRGVPGAEANALARWRTQRDEPTSDAGLAARPPARGEAPIELPPSPRQFKTMHGLPKAEEVLLASVGPEAASESAPQPVRVAEVPEPASEPERVGLASPRDEGTVRGLPGLTAADLAAHAERQVPQRPVLSPGRLKVREPEPGPAPAPVVAPAPPASGPASAELRSGAPASASKEAPVVERKTIAGLPGLDLEDIQREMHRPAAGLTFKLDEPDIEVPSHLEEVVDALEEASERDEVGAYALDHLTRFHRRVILFTLRGMTASVWMAGASGDASITQPEGGIHIAAIACLARPATERACYLGPVLDPGPVMDDPEAVEGVNTLRGMLRGEMPVSCVVAPLSIKGRPIGLIYCDDGPRRAVTVDRERLSYVQYHMEEALQRVILLRKRQR